jgi:chloride channel 3/4/5
MVGLMFSKLVGDAFDRRSIFEAHLVLNRYPFLNSKDRISPKIRVSDAMSRDLLALPMHGHTVESLTDQLTLLGELRITGFPIVTTLKDRFIVGYINRSELYTALCLALRNPSITPQTRCYFAMLSLRFPRNDPYVDLRPWLHPSPIQVVEHTPLYRVHDMFKKMGLRFVLVSCFGRLVGVLTKKDIHEIIDRQRTTNSATDTTDDQQATEQRKKKAKTSYAIPSSGGVGALNDHEQAQPPLASQFDYALM